jgi:sugar phosphate isomerase/epimerase
MRPAVVGFLPGDVKLIDDEVARKVKNEGFSGVSLFLQDPYSVSEEELVRIRTLLADHGLSVAQCNARYECLINPNEELRKQGVRTLGRACWAAKTLSAGTMYVRPGSISSAGHWMPHPENHHPRTVERLILSLREVAKIAEGEGVTLALEGHITSTLDTPEMVRGVIEAVGSPALRFNIDPVNFVGCLRDAYDTTSLINRLFDLLGRYTVAAHAKDVYVEDRHVLHLGETVIGDGLLDQETFLRRFEEVCPEGYVIIEHLPDELIPKAKRALDEAAKRAGLRWRISLL